MWFILKVPQLIFKNNTAVLISFWYYYFPLMFVAGVLEIELTVTTGIDIDILKDKRARI